MAEIAAASQEQAQGIEQINRAIVEMDKVTQQMAASADESASSSEEMNNQAGQMKAFVGELTLLVSGRTNGAAAEEASGSLSNKLAGLVRGRERAFPAPAKGDRVRPVIAHDLNIAKPEQVIPLDSRPTKDF